MLNHKDIKVEVQYFLNQKDPTDILTSITFVTDIISLEVYEIFMCFVNHFFYEKYLGILF